MADDDQITSNPEDALGDAGKRALDAERKARTDAERRAADIERRLKEFEDRDKSELQKLQDAIAERDSQLADLPRQVRQQVVRFASMATQAGFLDPEDALLNIDVDLADADAIKAALADLAERKPHLVRAQKPADKLPQRPKAPDGSPLGAPMGDDPKERAAAALRALRS